ncbi:hypothetical protein SAMN04487967_3697 [Natronorubrum sediminis]|uniref:Uncharacterized protein n=1 Tax=Natronorubrum sediminis TaxID=640943 RepID=A0A1H6G537_9EURY|nr:hypothetical protein SAMN04487967_3697 [Natronorubrum sediminis]
MPIATSVVLNATDIMERCCSRRISSSFEQEEISLQNGTVRSQAVFVAVSLLPFEPAMITSRQIVG